ncbi:MAG TPA: GNAT family N-acetyltransferase [Polyangiaceae bacterium]|nr:GNAT family N-acetyltransferase [Polyangiaceae bacterium]
MDTPLEVVLSPASESEAPVLENLLELYLHDLSAVFPNVAIGADGRFGYRRLSLYWSEPTVRFPFLVRRAGQLAGFVLAVHGSTAGAEPEAFDIAEFFVLRNQRRAGVGRLAARALWNRLPGRWTVRVSEGNVDALPFWTSVIHEYTAGQATHRERAGTAHPWRVFDFETMPRSAIE